jgi:hypothetical protein
MDPARVGFSIRSLGGKAQLHCNAAFPPFLDLRHRIAKKSLEQELVTRYEMKLVLHTSLSTTTSSNEDEFAEELKKQVSNLEQGRLNLIANVIRGT